MPSLFCFTTLSLRCCICARSSSRPFTFTPCSAKPCPACSKFSEDCSSAFEGMQPMLVQVPPRAGLPSAPFHSSTQAVASPRGLVVPIVRNADQLSLADIEKTIADFGKRAQEGKLAIEELTGGTFSISNGGVFGSMLSTPIINPPQAAILGVHATKERAVVEHGQVVVRPMNYLALSYDHRIIDGREAVLSLVAMKEALEDPARLALEI